jgi:O-antigen/teichoic acid export membrane protein
MLTRGLIGYLPVNIVQAVAGFGAIVVFTRLLSPSDYGAYALGFSVMSVVHTGLFTWIEAAMARFYAAEVENGDRAAMFATLYRAWAVMAIGLPTIGAAVLIFTPAPPNLKLALGTGLATILGRSLLKLEQERRRAAGEVGRFALVDMVQTGGGFVLGAALAGLGWGGAGPLAGMGMAAAMLAAFALPKDIERVKAGRFDRVRFGAYLAYGLPLSLSLVLSLVLATTDRLVLAAYLNEAAVGAYHAGYSLSNRTLDVMFIWLGMAGGPAAVAALERGGYVALRATALEQARLMALIAAPAAAGVALIARPLATLMVGGGLAAQAGMVTPWIAVSALFAGAATYYFHTAFTLARRTRLLLLAMAIPALANLGLALWLVPRFGLQGAMWGTTASYATGLLASALLGRRALALPIPWMTLAKVGIATGIMALALTAMPRAGGWIEILSKTSVGVAVYGAMALLLDAGEARRRLAAGLDWLRARNLGAGAPA